jgi:hypothetical protein
VEPSHRFGTRGWTSRQGHATFESYESAAAKFAQESESLIWYVNPESRVPIWLQKLGLWLLHRVMRRPLPR